MSYFDFFMNNNKDTNSDSIKGMCYSMCPQDEINMREKEELVHVLEVLGPVRKFVKSFSRSAADSNVAVPWHLRPYAVLQDTVQYLLLEVTKRIDVSTPRVYDFINDRLRAVRQDMTIQRLPPNECIKLLEPMIRFYVYYGYKLCELPLEDYDPVLNKKYLLECLKWFLTCCDSIDSEGGQDVDLAGFLSSLEISSKYKLKCDRVLMESLYLMSNMDDLHPLFRCLSLPKKLKSAPTLQLAYSIAIANLKGNYMEVCKLLDQLCPLTYCALCLYLPTLQRRALLVMSHAYSSKNLTVPVDVMKQWLRFSSGADVVATCTHYGLRVQGDAVRFARGDFKHDAAILQPKKLLLCDKKINLTIDHVFTYCTLSI